MNIEQLEAKLAEAGVVEVAAWRQYQATRDDCNNRMQLATEYWNNALAAQNKARQELERAKLRAEIEAEFNGVKQ